MSVQEGLEGKRLVVRVHEGEDRVQVWFGGLSPEQKRELAALDYAWMTQRDSPSKTSFLQGLTLDWLEENGADRSWWGLVHTELVVVRTQE